MVSFQQETISLFYIESCVSKESLMVDKSHSPYSLAAPSAEVLALKGYFKQTIFSFGLNPNIVILALTHTSAKALKGQCLICLRKNQINVHLTQWDTVRINYIIFN